MKVVILCGGKGERLRELTHRVPKPMAEVGDRPLVWHVMKMYANAGLTDFVLCLGYRGDVIWRYFTSRAGSPSSARGPSATDASVEVVDPEEGWTVRLVHTGEETLTGGRLRRVAEFIDGDTFHATYSDSVSDLDLRSLVSFHRRHGRLATVTAVKPPPRFGVVQLEGCRVTSFTEKRREDEPWISAGFFVFNRVVLDRIDGDDVVLEEEPLRELAASGELYAFLHEGFWHCVDTLPELQALRKRWEAGDRPWALWEDHR